MEISRKKFFIGAASALLMPQSGLAEAKSRLIYNLPQSPTKRFSWTIDDGASESAVRSYLNIAENTDNHLTLFVTSNYKSWRVHSKQISKLLNQGKIQLGNHTVSHRDLTQLSDMQVRKELYGCHLFMLQEFGYDARPYFRPPYGNSNSRVHSVAAELGYTVPTLWYGSLGDSGNTPEQRMVELASKWIADERIIIDHCNRPKSQKTLNQIQGIIKSRGLKSVTLKEAFGKTFR